MSPVNPAMSLEENLFQTDLGWGETYAEHKQNCEFGCALCAPERRREKELERLKNTEIAGISGSRVLEIRKEFNQSNKISRYFFSHNDMRNKNGALIKEVYIFLQHLDFSDEQIRKYFGINNHEWQRFKADKFPDWSNKDQQEFIMAKETPKAIKWYKEKYVMDHAKEVEAIRANR